MTNEANSKLHILSYSKLRKDDFFSAGAEGSDLTNLTRSSLNPR
jgi:hypothetical protein